jgi:glycosyltransferase involved in cell wall biosynthesis
MTPPADRRTRILFVSHSAELAGAEMCLLHHLRYLDRGRWDPVVVLPDEGPLRRQIDMLGVRTERLPMEWWIPGGSWHGQRHLCEMLGGLNRNVDALAGIIVREEIDIVQTNTVVIIDGALAAAKTGRPHVWHVHENLLESETLKPYIAAAAVFAWVDLLSDRVVAVSEYLGRRLRECIATDRIEVIVGGVPVADFCCGPAGDRHPLRDALGCDERTPLVGTVGSLTKRKNPEGFVDAAARVLAFRPDAMFAWIGNLTDRAAAAAAMKKARRLGIGERVRFVGFLPSIRETLADLDVVVHPSFNENLSLSCIEAMAAGKPVVAVRCGGPEEVVVEGETGFLVPGGDVETMAARIVALLADPGLRARMGERGRLLARERFDASRTTREFERLYERLLVAGRRPGSAVPAPLLSSLLDLLRRAGEAGSAGDHLRLIDLLRICLRRTGQSLRRRFAPGRPGEEKPPAGSGV